MNFFAAMTDDERAAFWRRVHEKEREQWLQLLKRQARTEANIAEAGRRCTWGDAVGRGSRVMTNPFRREESA